VKLLVVILNYNVTELTLDCLRSLEPYIHRVPGAKVAVLENGSGGDAAERLAAAIRDHGWSEWVELLTVHPNRGFTGGNNLVIRAALARPDPPEYFLLLNADTLVFERTLEELVACLDHHPRAGIAGSLLLTAQQVPKKSSPFRFQGIATELDRGLRLGVVSRLLAPWTVIAPTPPEACAVDWVSGSCMLLRRTMLDEIGLLDEGLYTYYDDIDICLRARRAGWETWFVPESRVIHLEGASTGLQPRAAKRRPSYWFQARRRHFLKNHGPTYTAVVDAALIVGFALWRVRRRLQRKPDSDPPHMLGDMIRHSVFVTGFEVTEVENPAMRSVAGDGLGR
jgi:N-acetylglucosaminyl-diphospho-decaprenol L-rhamnosyltransferase